MHGRHSSSPRSRPAGLGALSRSRWLAAASAAAAICCVAGAGYVLLPGGHAPGGGGQAGPGRPAVPSASSGTVGAPGGHGAGAAGNCTPSAILVNPCRPWFGAAAEGNPQAAANPIAQFTYLEKLIGRRLDIFHDYHPPGSLPLNATEIRLARSRHTYVFAAWKPATTWAAADGGNAAVNAQIDRAAASIKSVAPHKIFLTIWHEPQNDVSGGTSCPTNPGAGAGTPGQYVAMWRNVERRFAADGVKNVVWVMDYSAQYKWACLVPVLWPGNSLVNWVTFDTYSAGPASTWQNTVGWFYGLLLSDSSPAADFVSKPWGVAEFGSCTNRDQASVNRYYLQARAALSANTYPRLKMYIVYAAPGPHHWLGCLTDYTATSAYDPAEQAYFNQFADAPVFSRGGG